MGPQKKAVTNRLPKKRQQDLQHRNWQQVGIVDYLDGEITRKAEPLKAATSYKNRREGGIRGLKKQRGDYKNGGMEEKVYGGGD